jgi:SSS family transporter
VTNLDLAILVAYLCATVLFGLWIGRGRRTAHDYLLGSRDLPWWALLISIVATETSTATFLSVPGLAFGGGLPGTTGDLRYLQLPIGYVIGRCIAARVLLPLYFKGELFTAYEALRVRSGAAVRTLASLLFLITRTLGDGLRLYLAALVLKTMLGCDLWVAVAMTSVATVLYTVFGGIKAVVWMDVVQFGVYMLGAGVALVVLGDGLPGGIAGAVATAAEQGHLRVFDFALDFGRTFTFWAGLIGGTVLSIGSHGVDQIIVQRYLAARSLRDAQRALVWSGPVVLLQFTFFLLLGLCLQQFYAAHPPDQPFRQSDAVFSDFIVNHLPHGLVGVVLGAVFAAAMGTLSSSLTASASALTNDFLLPLCGRTPGDPWALRAARGATLLFAVLYALVGVSGLGGGDAVVNQVLGIATVTTGVILGVFLLALHPRNDPRSALCGLVGGLVGAAVVVFALPALTIKLAWPWHGLVTSSATVLTGTAARLLRRAR